MCLPHNSCKVSPALSFALSGAHIYHTEKEQERVERRVAIDPGTYTSRACGYAPAGCAVTAHWGGAHPPLLLAGSARFLFFGSPSMRQSCKAEKLVPFPPAAYCSLAGKPALLGVNLVTLPVTMICCLLLHNSSICCSPVHAHYVRQSKAGAACHQHLELMMSATKLRSSAPAALPRLPRCPPCQPAALFRRSGCFAVASHRIKTSAVTLPS